MVRRSFLAAAFLVILSASTVLAATKTVAVSGTAYTPASVTVPMGGTVAWKNKTARKRVVAADTGFVASWFLPSTTVPANGTSVARTFPEAGSFGYHDTVKGFRGTVVVPMTVDLAVVTVNTKVTLRLGSVNCNAPVYHYVQARKNGGAWGMIATTGGTTWGWTVPSAGTWQIETKLHHALGAGDSGWSPIVTVTALAP